jgi:hypothetical protein
LRWFATFAYEIGLCPILFFARKGLRGALRL